MHLSFSNLKTTTAFQTVSDPQRHFPCKIQCYVPAPSPPPPKKKRRHYLYKVMLCPAGINPQCIYLCFSTCAHHRNSMLNNQKRKDKRVLSVRLEATLTEAERPQRHALKSTCIASPIANMHLRWRDPQKASKQVASSLESLRCAVIRRIHSLSWRVVILLPFSICRRQDQKTCKSALTCFSFGLCRVLT